MSRVAADFLALSRVGHLVEISADIGAALAPWPAPKVTQPFRREAEGASGRVARSLQAIEGVLLARSLPSASLLLRATHPKFQQYPILPSRLCANGGKCGCRPDPQSMPSSIRASRRA